MTSPTRACRCSGRSPVAWSSTASSGTAPGFGPLDLVFSDLTVTGFALPPRLAMPGWYQDVADDLLRRVADGRLQVVVDAQVRLDEAARAHARLQDRSSVGKVLLVP